MKIIIIGCGKVGYALAEELTEEKHEVTIIDSSSERLQEVDGRAGCLTDPGKWFQPECSDGSRYKKYGSFDFCDRFR